MSKAASDGILRAGRTIGVWIGVGILLLAMPLFIVWNALRGKNIFYP